MESTNAWERPWSMEEIVKNSENWTLAGDAALLNTLKAFSDKLLQSTTEISNNLDGMVNRLDVVSARLDISTNQMQSLRNTQFVESRVYEEDETSVVEKPEKSRIEEKSFSDHDKNELIKDALCKGLSIIDMYFEKTEVNGPNQSLDIRLQSKDMYKDRPLPPVVGTEEWYKMYEFHGELAETVSLTNSDYEHDADSISQIKESESSSSELDLSNKADVSTNNNYPIGNSTLNDTSFLDKHDIFRENKNIVDPKCVVNEETPTVKPLSSKSFVDELASSLVSKREIIEPVVNKNPIQKVVASASLFEDEPPPLDQQTMSSKTTDPNPYSSGKGLFDDDNEDDLFWTQKPSQPTSSGKSLFDDDSGEFKPPSSVQKTTNLKPRSKGLFDDDESSDDDIFSSNQTKISILSSNKTTPPIFDDEPPEIEPTTVKKKPFGGVSLFGAGVGKQLSKTRISSSEESLPEAISQEVKIPSSEPEPNETVKKKPGLFDAEDDDLFSGDLFGKVGKKKISLFDDDDDLFSSVPKTEVAKETFKTEPSKAKFKSLFDDLDDDDLSTVSFSNKNSINVDAERENDEISSLVQEETTNVSVIPEAIKEQVKDNPPPRISLFQDSPPSDEEWDTRSNPSEEEITENPSNSANFETFNSSLFNSSLLPYNQSSGIGRDVFPIRSSSTVEAGYDSSFDPMVSSTRRLSSDIFNEEQSSDSLFSKSSSITVPKLEDIQENKTSNESEALTFIDITPSGKSDDFASNLSASLSRASDDKEIVEKISEPANEKFDHLDSEIVREPNSKMEQENVTKPKIPGKLNLGNLKINVNALVPGYVPKKNPKELLKSQSLELPKEEEEDSTIEPKANNNNLQNEEKGDFDTTDNVQILPSITKDRARIAVKRRPSTRRARQDNIRKSMPDFSILTDNFSENEEEKQEALKPPTERVKSLTNLIQETPEEEKTTSQTQQVKPSTERPSILFEDNLPPSLDLEKPQEKSKASQLFDDDSPDELFSSSNQKSNSLFETTKQNLFEDLEDDLFPKITKKPPAKKHNTKSLFDSPDSDEDLFAEKPKPTETEQTKPLEVKAPKESTTKPTSIFDDEDSGEDLFFTSKLPPKKVAKAKSSLFDDEDDDDIFGDISVSVQEKPVERPQIKTSSVRKLENIETVEDPLSSMLK